MGNAENRMNSIWMWKSYSIRNRANSFCYFEGSVISSCELGSRSFRFRQLQGMDIDKDLISRFIRDKDMVLVVWIFKSELSEFEWMLGSEPDCSDFLSKLLCVRGVKLIQAGSSDWRFISEKIDRWTRVESKQKVGRWKLSGGMRSIVVCKCKIW